MTGPNEKDRIPWLPDWPVLHHLTWAETHAAVAGLTGLPAAAAFMHGGTIPQTTVSILAVLVLFTILYDVPGQSSTATVLSRQFAYFVGTFVGSFSVYVSAVKLSAATAVFVALAVWAIFFTAAWQVVDS
jgi:hypothetical protein